MFRLVWAMDIVIFTCPAEHILEYSKGSKQISNGMGPYLLQLPSPPSLTPLSILKQRFPMLNNNDVNFVFRCLSYRSGGRFQFEDEPCFDDGGEYQFAGAKKQRIWWRENEDRLDWEEDEDEEHWMVKMFKAFGVMLPAIAVSVLVGTGPSAFLMALAVPVGQSVLSLVFDIVKGRNSGGWRSAPRSQKKKKPFATASNNFKTRKGKQKGRRKSSYQSWAHTTDNFENKGPEKGSEYGGWDQLDMEGRRSQRKAASSIEPNESPVHEGEGKLSRMGRVREGPLLLRLLIAFFPFLGSFTRFLI